MSNPLLNHSTLPLFSQIETDHIEPAIDQLLAENRQALAELLQEKATPSWENFITPLDELGDRLSKAWSPVRHLNSVMDSEALRSVHERCLQKLTQYYTEIGLNEELFNKVKQLKNAQTATLNPTQHKILDDMLLDFHLSGVDLPDNKKQRYKEIQESLTALNSKFEQNVLDATLAWKQHHPNTDKLAGLPESALAMAKQAAEQESLDGWLLNLQIPCYIAVVTYAENRELRRDIYTAYNTRASEQGPNAGEWDNSEIIEQILALRHEQAQLLGFANYAEQSLATKMAETTDDVLNFLNDLVNRGKSAAEAEYAELAEFAASDLKGETLQAWDVAYYAEKLRIERYELSQEELKPWFPAEKVINGLFDIVGRLYGLQISQQQDTDVWHPDVSFYVIKDAQGQLRGQFYLDLYARPHKRGGAWMDECVNRFQRAKEVQTPVAYLTCNLSPPVADKPALFTHDEVVTLFHEFGHGLHHMLTQIDYPAVAGINGVEWDAVELPSQFMENWCWEKSALDLITGHYQSGEPLPAELVDKLKAARNFQAAMQLLRQMEFSLFDFRLHLEYQPEASHKTQQLLDEIREQVAVVPRPDFVRFQNSFSHIFAGGYAAGYYSYKWAEVLSADAFAKFEEQGVFNSTTGQEFMQCILERGGSSKAMELFERFRGRKPTIDALLRHTGLAA